MQKFVGLFFIAISIAFPTKVFSEDYYSRKLIDELNAKILDKISPVAYPDLDDLELKIISEMPKLTGNETKRADFTNLRDGLKLHGRRVKDLERTLLSICESYDRQGKFILESLVPAKIISPVIYNDEIVENIKVQKRDCNAENKHGPYWEIYDLAIQMLADRDVDVLDAEAECRVNHPNTC